MKPDVIAHPRTKAQIALRALTAATLLGVGLLAARAEGQSVVTVGERKAGTHHVEPHSATNPKDSREIVVAAMRVRSPDLGTWQVVAFRSLDGGRSWQSTELPARGGVHCSADPWVAWGHGRSVYVACMAPIPTPDGKDFHYEVFLHRSRDAGRTWAEPLQVPVDRAGEWDHPVLVRAPARPGTLRDTLWIVGTRPRRSGNEFGVVRFTEDRERFDSMRVYRPPQPANYSFGSAAAMDGERVVFTYFTMNQQPPYPLYVVRISGAEFRSAVLREHVMPAGFPMLTASPATGGARRMLAAVWLEGPQVTGLDVVVAVSTDGGGTWRSPQGVTSDQPRVFRTRPNAALDAHGALALTWFESPSGSNCGDVRFRVLDGPSGRVVSDQRLSRGATACPTDPPLGPILERWRGGGDYAAIQAIRPGVFDLVWADLRDDGHAIRFVRAHTTDGPNER